MKLFCKISKSVTPTTNDRGIAALMVTPDACFSPAMSVITLAPDA
jgi:hypothetical protein